MSDIESTVDHAAEQQYASFLKREPVVLSHLLAGPIVGLVTLFAPGDPSHVAEQITAAAVTLALVLQGFLVRRYVTPAWKRATRHPRPTPEA